MNLRMKVGVSMNGGNAQARKRNSLNHCHAGILGRSSVCSFAFRRPAAENYRINAERRTRNASQRHRKRLAVTLSIIFTVAVIMGAGPGMYLVGSATDGHGPLIAFGMPAPYAWVVFWFLVQATVILVAYFRLWDDAPDKVAKDLNDRKERGGS